MGHQDLGHRSGVFAGQEFVVVADPTTDFPHSPRAESPAVLLLKGFSSHVYEQ